MVNLDCLANYSGLCRKVFFMVLSCSLCCCCLDPALVLSARFCFLVGIRFCVSRYCVIFQLPRVADSVTGAGLGLCTV